MKFVIAAIAVLVFAVFAVTTSIGACAAPVNGSKCTSPQAICALESGGRCNPKNGAWAVGWIGGRIIGGSTNGWQACIDRLHQQQRKSQ